ncbi:GNAT family N-acetyltransferase [Streptomyces katsurahamanus]|uniref:GNAT family N-acetyltransferase n=1 Tax=Streptomyces katsurahamanus TaxID=2577098 RepID=A0ABW9NTL7_9ACTN|nr:GNAT family N-acetyltransferase [Streptomyces katsurahamanus]MQS36219.1 GNAT family N-acetyltransferase [Streptomyces katsurahamanus]
MSTIVRDFRPGDAISVCRVLRAVLPHQVTTPESVLHEVRTAEPAARSRTVVAERDGEIIGTAAAGMLHDAREPGLSTLSVHVHPDHRGRGTGGLLLRTAQRHLAAEGATQVSTWATDEPASLSFAGRHGYRPSRSSCFQRLDLTEDALPPLPEPPPGVALRTVADFADDPRPVYRVDTEATTIDPADIDTEFAEYDDWLEHTWAHPLVDRALSTVVLKDGEPVAFTLVESDGSARCLSGVTATVPAHRGRGYAKLAKSDSLHRARDAGYRSAFTSNDVDNEPMLAINTWFGYRVCGTEVRHARSLG